MAKVAKKKNFWFGTKIQTSFMVGHQGKVVTSILFEFFIGFLRNVVILPHYHSCNQVLAPRFVHINFENPKLLRKGKWMD